ncbi:MAG: hypothetical protein RLZZ419_1460 [Pseudomonadota bacterium]|jgi:hypothetical protein
MSNIRVGRVMHAIFQVEINLVLNLDLSGTHGTPYIG